MLARYRDEWEYESKDITSDFTGSGVVTSVKIITNDLAIVNHIEVIVNELE